jgi:hypothetical protein
MRLADLLDKPQSYVAKVENLNRRLDVVALNTSPHQFMTQPAWLHA